ncbi:protein NO VEIN domain-containing protein [Lutibacter citreus]|uniref:protein NO VEIN domain-containing protein n=1 Tax=Lutibacter citreus TaxID=2138210 RepID=UPI000DBE4C59|nr:DUF3883 domain-containing protein [Lutibacter citreus]
METHFEILIDASGSMGYMKGSKEYENKYLLPDGSTRTDLVKKILGNSIVPKLSFANTFKISTFRNEFNLDKNGERIVVNNSYKDYPNIKPIYSGEFDKDLINSSINQIINPDIGGTPLFWALAILINKSVSKSLNIIVLSDGDANDRTQFDIEILNVIKNKKIECKIYFIGIDQDEVAIKKSKNLASSTGGFYVNLDIMNYDESKFESLLFDFKTTLTSTALSGITELQENVEEEKPIKVNIENNEKVEEPKSIKLSEKVAENSKSLQLISNQLDNIVNELKYLRTSKNSGDLTNEFEFDEDEEHNKKIGRKCENFLYKHFQKDNCEEVLWLNEKEEQGSPFDIRVKVKGEYFFIECKGTSTSSKEFYLTKNEWKFYLENRKNYRLYFVSEINSDNPKIIRIEDLISSLEKLELIPFSSINRRLKADRTVFQIQ